LIQQIYKHNIRQTVFYDKRSKVVQLNKIGDYRQSYIYYNSIVKTFYENQTNIKSKYLTKHAKIACTFAAIMKKIIVTFSF